MLLLPDFRVRQRDYLLEISRAITSQLDLGEVLRMILRSSVALLAGEIGLIALRESGSSELRTRALIGVPADQVGVFEPLLEVYQQTGGEDLEAGGLDVNRLDETLRKIARALGMPLRQVIALPMYVAGDFIGMIYVFRAFSGTASFNDRMVLQSFADQAAIAVYNARLYQAIDQERKRLAGILDHSADGVMILDGHLRILRFNRAMSRISGHPPEEAIGQRYAVIVSWARRPQGRDLREALQDGWPVEREHEAPVDTLYVEGDLLRPDGTTISVGITHAPLLDADGRLLNVIVNVRDITHFRKVQEMQSTFISVISHELKTPVALIKGYAGTLRREDAEWDRGVLEQGLTVIEEESDRLAELIENLLEASKLQAEGMRLNLDMVSLEALAQLSVSRFETQTNKHEFAVDFPPDFPRVMGDQKRLRQVLDNLLSNAIKYSPQGGTITITGTFSPSSVRIAIRDQGVGIPRDEWDLIFDRFYRVDDGLTSKAKGTGLGLYLSRAIIQAHGGEIGVMSHPGKGSEFYIVLPRSQPYLQPGK